MGHEIEFKYFDKNGYLWVLIRASILVFELLKVVGNEKEGRSGKWQIIDIGLGLW
jgi:hypothetical protein